MRRILKHWPLHKKKKQKTLASLATANSTLRDAREKQHQVRMSRGCFPKQEVQCDRSNRRQERKYVMCSGPHWASKCHEKQGKPGEKKGEATANTAYSEVAMAVHTGTSMFAREAVETGKALVDCGATRSMGSWEVLDGLARMNEQ